MIQSAPIAAYAGRTNKVLWAIQNAADLSSPVGITRCVFVFKRDDYDDVLIDSTVVPDAFILDDTVFVRGERVGCITWTPSVVIDTGSFPVTGIWKADVYLYDAVHIEGIFYGQFEMDVRSLGGGVNPSGINAVFFSANGAVLYVDTEFGVTNLTITAWIRAHAATNSRAIYIGSESPLIDIEASSNTLFVVNGDNSVTSVGISTDEWTFVAVTLSSTGPTGVLKYGNLSGLTTTSVDLSNGMETTGGRLAIGNDPFDTLAPLLGDVCQVRVWTRVLSDAEILAERNSSTAVSLTGIVCSYPMNGAADLADEAGILSDLTAGTHLQDTDGPTGQS